MLSYHLALAGIVAVILCLRPIFRRWVSPRWIHALWLAVLLRMLLPSSVLVEVAVLPPVEPAPALTNQAVLTQSPAYTQAVLPSQSPLPPVSYSAFSPAPTQGLRPAPHGQVQATQASPGEEKADFSPMQLRWGITAALALWFVASALRFWHSLARKSLFEGKFGALNVYRSPVVKAPCLAGLIPAVYLPMDSPEGEEREWILRHEHCHFRRGDFLWSWLRIGAVCLFWFNPAVWIAAHYSKIDGELACDDAVCASCSREKRLAYADTLIRALPTKQRFALPWGGSPMKERIIMLLEKRKKNWILGILVGLLTLCAVGCSTVELQAVPKLQKQASEQNTPVAVSTAVPLPVASSAVASQALPASSADSGSVAASSCAPASVTAASTSFEKVPDASAQAPFSSVAPTASSAVPSASFPPPPVTQEAPSPTHVRGEDGVDVITYSNGRTLSVRVPEQWYWDSWSKMYYSPWTDEHSSKRSELHWGADVERDKISDLENEGRTLWDQPVYGTTEYGLQFVIYRTRPIVFGGFEPLGGYRYSIYFTDAPTTLYFSVHHYEEREGISPSDFLETVVLPIARSVNIT